MARTGNGGALHAVIRPPSLLCALQAAVAATEHPKGAARVLLALYVNLDPADHFWPLLPYGPPLQVHQLLTCRDALLMHTTLVPCTPTYPSLEASEAHVETVHYRSGVRCMCCMSRCMLYVARQDGLLLPSQAQRSPRPLTATSASAGGSVGARTFDRCKACRTGMYFCPVLPSVLYPLPASPSSYVGLFLRPDRILRWTWWRMLQRISP